jgi:hypothetical protein
MFQAKVFTESESTQLYSIPVSDYRTVYEIMWKRKSGHAADDSIMLRVRRRVARLKTRCQNILHLEISRGNGG